jgi:hypothetical protein
VAALDVVAAGGGSQAWLCNPRVLQLLREAARALRAGRLSEQQLAAALSQQAKVHNQLPAGPSMLQLCGKTMQCIPCMCVLRCVCRVFLLGVWLGGAKRSTFGLLSS